DTAIAVTLAKLGQVLKVQRVFLFTASDDGLMMAYAQEWCGPGVPEFLRVFPGFHTDTMPWLMERLRRFETVVLDSPSDLPESAANERRVFGERRTGKLVAIPLVIDGGLGGFTGVEMLWGDGRAAVEWPQGWHDGSVRILNMVAEILSGALQRRRGEARLRESEQRYRQLFLGNRAPALLLDPESLDIRDANPAAARFYGYRREDLVTKNFRDFAVKREEDEENKLLAARDAEGGAESSGGQLYRQRLASGEERDIEIHAGPVIVENQSLVYAILHDVTERRRAEERIRHMASHDGLTGLPNRAMGLDRLYLAMARSRRNGTLSAILFVDLDGFKAVNDHHGHDSGDALLRELATRLRACVRETDTVCRLGGDEFAIVLSDLTRTSDLKQVAGHVIKTVGDPFNLPKTSVRIGASVGIALYPRDGKDIDTLVKAADKAMYAVKQHGKNHFRFASEELDDAAE
ncbi:MAG: diguanylate cyclase domain-containing protein, partial [Rhodospirillales bacterium]